MNSVTPGDPDWNESFTDRTVVVTTEYVIVPGLLMRPEHSETKAKTETRECETEIETDTETKNLL